MKELDSFTVERLEGWLEVATKDGPWRNMEVCSGMLTDLLNIALAAKRAEPVGYWNDACDLDDGAFSYANDAGCTRPLYTTPQLNSPEIPDGWNGTLETAAKLIDLCRTYTILGDSGSYKERTINDCELTMQEIESYLAAAPEKENG